MNREKAICETPTPGKKPTRIERWKYEAVRRAILAALDGHHDGVPFRELAQRVKPHLSPDELARLGSLGWYTTTVKLDLEVKGEIARLPTAKPQRLVRC